MHAPEPRRQIQLVPLAQTAVFKLELENILGTGMGRSLTSQKGNVRRRTYLKLVRVHWWRSGLLLERFKFLRFLPLSLR